METFTRKANSKCSFCNKQIYRRPSQIKKYQHTFCSKACYGKYYVRPLKCIICGNEYSRHFNKKTCSRACANKNRTGTKYKINRPHDKVTYINGLKIRLIIERGQKCQRCKYSKIEILIVHHRDRDRSHNDLSNLELLCPNCHAEEHYLEKSWYKRYNVAEYREKLILKEPNSIFYGEVA